jgi:streptogramin lyase
MRRVRRALTPLVTLAAALAAVAAPAWAVGSIPNLTIGDPGAQLAGPPVVAQKLTLPFDAAPAAGTDDTGSPEDDLAEALDDLSTAPDVATAASARTLALSILEGDPIPRKVYSGIPLLNWNAPAKVKTVPAGGNVTVSEVRFGDHVLSDTWLLDFADPNAPFTITYKVAEVGVGFGGAFAPTVLVPDGSGQPSVLQTLALPELLTGTTTTNRFHPAGAAEHTRLAVQQFTVKMPPPHDVAAIVDPGLEPGPGVTSLVTLEPATAERLAAAQADFGFSGPAPTDAQKLAAIGHLGANAPEKVLWTHLQDLDPADPGFLAAAHQLGSQDADLVAAMRSRYAPGVQTDPGADVAVVLQNDEAFLSRRRLHLDPGHALTVSVTNADGFAHRFDALQLHDRQPAFGALDWGTFQWSPLGDETTLAPGASQTITLTPNDTTFELWLGDPDSGDQAGLPLRLDRGPLRQSLEFTPDWSHPNHAAVDAQGHLWVTLGGVDALAEVTPADDLAAATEREFPLPGGDATFATGGKLDPHDVAVDGNNIVWATLADGNAIARLDPAHASPGSSDGIRVYPLADCPTCDAAFPPEPGAAQPPTRDPEQLAVQQDGAGDTLVWFTELSANAIGVVRVAGDGTLLDRIDVPCDCAHPKGIALGDDGSVWFSEEDGNRIGRLTLSPGPFEAAGMQIVHYGIPSAPTVARPGGPNLATSSPHSLAVDGLGRVWFSEEENASLGYVDPTHAHPGTADGVTEVPLPNNEFREQASPADLTVDRNGKVFFVDEYGDAVGAASAAAGFDQYWRPRARQSITDKPVVDANGNLWFTETGANLLTRLSGVAAPALPPAAPPVFTADTLRHTISATGLRDVADVEVEVQRGGSDAAHETVPVTGGSFTLDAPVHGGDLVRLTLHGTYPRAPLSFPVSDLDAVVSHDGSIHGKLVLSDQPPADAVQVDANGRTAGAPIARDGGFASPTGVAAPSASGTVTYAGGTIAGIFRTVAAFGPAPTASGSEPQTGTAAGTTPSSGAPAASGSDTVTGAARATKSKATPKARTRKTVTVSARGRRALALVSYRWRHLGYRIVFAPARVGVRAMTDTRHHTITIYVRTTDRPQRIAHDIAHELGHAYDARFLRPRDRHAYLVLRGRPRAVWWPAAAGSDYASGAGDFAEVFAICHAPSKEFRSTLAPRPKRPCALLGALTARRKR